MDTIIIAVVAIGVTVSLRSYLQRQRRGRAERSSSGSSEEVTTTLGWDSRLSPSKMLPGEKTVEVCRVHKSFGGKEVVDDISFEVKSGEIFGMVGPNGAGKTTTIRMLMDIIKPDSGGVKILGESLRESTKDRIGYLPEERGLYRRITVAESLEYLARLKSLTPGAAKSGTDNLLHRVGMFQHKDKKIEQLSRGMGQIIQFVATIIHDPDLVILDEPFAGLDPVNREMLKELIRELRQHGKTIILSTHQMNEVEELCDRILMINKGKTVLYGELSEIRSRFRNNSIFLECEGSFDGLAGVTGEKNHGKFVELFLDGKTSSQEVLAQLLARDVTVDRFEVSTPSLNEIFIQVVKEEP
ncbi:ATP-binding cassette domain-containing protein [Dehalococcoidia bacterium]|nr:ATP-binding cassette domain-containing protein [Dehalococcoidia bacterium]